MAKTVTLLQLRTQVRQRADMVNSTFCSDAELNGFLNSSYGELYDLLIQKFGEQYVATSADQNTVSGTADYALPATFFKLLGADLSSDGGTRFRSLKRFMFAERNARQSGEGVGDPKYAMHGAYLRLMPAPSGVSVLRIWFVPVYTTLANDSDTIDGVNGWEDYVVVDAAIKAKDKEESDVTVLMAQKQMLLARIEAAAANRDAGEAKVVVEVEDLGEDCP